MRDIASSASETIRYAGSDRASRGGAGKDSRIAGGASARPGIFSFEISTTW